MKFNGFDPGTPPIPGSPRPGRPEPPSKGTPSTTINGALPERTEPVPRILIVAPAPGCPLLLVICNPATLPWINCSGEVLTPLLKSFSLTEAIDPVRSFFLAVP